MKSDDYVHQQNLELYRKILAETPADGSRRTMLMKLLAEEKAREAAGARMRRSK